MWTAVKFVIVGTLNTLVGGSIIFALMFFGLSPLLSNAGGYAVGLATSFVLNGRWTFNSSRALRYSFLPFLLVFALAFASNLSMLTWALDKFSSNVYYAQSLAIATFTIVNFFGCRWLVFPRD